MTCIWDAVDLNLLVALDALLHERHVTRAAARVGLTQSATSHALGRLRELFGDELLVRSPHGMEATVRAVALAEPVVFFGAHFLVAPRMVAQSDLLLVVAERIALLFAEELALRIFPVPVEVRVRDLAALAPAHAERSRPQVAARPLG